MTIDKKQIKHDVQNEEYAHEQLCNNASEYADNNYPNANDNEHDEIIDAYIQAFVKCYN